MIPFLAVILAVIVVVALWRMLDPNKTGQARTVSVRRKLPRRGPLPPDDNPEFLSELSKRLPAHGPSRKPDEPKDDGGLTPA